MKGGLCGPHVNTPDDRHSAIDLGQEAGAAIGIIEGCHWPLTGVRSPVVRRDLTTDGVASLLIAARWMPWTVTRMTSLKPTQIF